MRPQRDRLFRAGPGRQGKEQRPAGSRVDLATSCFMPLPDSHSRNVPPPVNRPADASVLASQPAAAAPHAASPRKSVICPAGFPAGSVAAIHPRQPLLARVTYRPR